MDFNIYIRVLNLKNIYTNSVFIDRLVGHRMQLCDLLLLVGGQTWHYNRQDHLCEVSKRL